VSIYMSTVGFLANGESFWPTGGVGGVASLYGLHVEMVEFEKAYAYKESIRLLAPPAPPKA
jgi:hypothetical protein